MTQLYSNGMEILRCENSLESDHLSRENYSFNYYLPSDPFLRPIDKRIVFVFQRTVSPRVLGSLLQTQSELMQALLACSDKVRISSKQVTTRGIGRKNG